MIKQSILGFKYIFSDKKYVALFVLLSAAFFFIIVIIQNIGMITTFVKIKGYANVIPLLFSLITGFHYNVTRTTYITSIIISLMSGMLFSMIIFKIKLILLEKFSFLSVFGAILGILAPGCAACSIGIAAILGISATTLYLLPFKGLEISLLAITILGFSLMNISKKLISCESQKLKLNKQK